MFAVPNDEFVLMKQRLYILSGVLIGLIVATMVIYWPSGGANSQKPLADAVPQVKPPDSDDDGDDTETAAPPGTQPVEYRRLAVLPAQGLARSGLSDLLTLELSNLSGVSLVEREQLAAITEEQRLSAMAGSDAAGRVALGKLLKADALIIVSNERIGNIDYIRLVVADTAMGVRLADSRVPMSANQSEKTVKALSTTIDQARRRFPQGVKLVVGVSPFLSKDLTHENDYLKGGLASLTENALFALPGVAVVEIDEARAVRSELDVSGNNSAKRALPFFIWGEYETSRGENAQPLIATSARITDGASTIQQFKTPAKPQSQAVSILTTDLPAAVLKSTAQGYRPLSRSGQIKLLARRANEFVALGSWQRAISLRESELVLNQSEPEQRKRIISETLQWLREEYDAIFSRWVAVRRAQYTSENRNPDPSLFDAQLKVDMDDAWPRCLTEWMRALDHLEFLVRNRQIAWREFDTLLNDLMDIDFTALRPSATRNKDLRLIRTRLQTLVKELGPALEELARQDLTNLPEVNAGRWRYLTWKCVLALPVSRADLAPVAELIEQFPADPNALPPYSLLRTFQNMTNQELAAELWPVTAENDLPALLSLLEKSNKRPLVILATIARVWMNDILDDHRRPRDEVRAQLKEPFLALCDIVEGHPQSYLYIRDIEFGTRAICMLELRAVASSSKTFRLTQSAAPNQSLKTASPTSETTNAASTSSPPQSGPITFEVRPVEVFLSKEKRIPISDWTDQQKFPTPPFDLFLMPCAAAPGKRGIDIAWDRHSVFLHRELGLLEPIMVHGDEIYRDVESDGRNIYIGTGQHGMFILDNTGKTVAHLGEEQGLPPADGGIAIAPISIGKVLVTGSFGAEHRGWIAMVENEKDTQRFSVDVFHKATHAADPAILQSRDTKALRAAAQDPEFVFRPDWAIFAPPGHDTPAGAVWIARGRANQFGVGDNEWLCVNLQTFKVSVHDFRMSPKPLRFITDDELIMPDGRPTRRRLRGKFEDGRQLRLIVCAPQSESHATILQFEGQYYIPGSDWYRFDPDSLHVEHIGPGIYSKEYPVTMLRYAVSSVCGLIGYSDKTFYPVSVDPKHPLAIHAMPNDWNGYRTAIKTFDRTREVFGNVRTVGSDRSIWTSGHGELEVTTHGGNPTFQSSPTERDLNLEIYLRLLQEEFTLPEEQQRLGLSAEQIAQLKKAMASVQARHLDTKRVAALYATYQSAKGEAAQDAARNALFSEIREIGETFDRRRPDLDQSLKAILTPNQFRAITYDPPE
jgi:hypothetical protein